MKFDPGESKIFAAAFLFMLAVAACATETNSISGGEKILFDRDVRPIFEQNCISCHGPEKPKSDFRLDVRNEALRGGDDNTNDIVPGHSGQSQLVRYISGEDEDIQMPPRNRPPLTSAQIAALRAWIDQGADWGTNAAPALIFSIEPELRWTDIHGDNKKFRELEGVPEGFGGGAENFSMSEQISPDEQFTVAGHALLPENDVKLSLALDKNNAGFVHSGFEEWRKYFDDSGGFYPGFAPSSFSLNKDLHEDIGRAWIDFGLTLPNSPQLVFGYEYQFRQGAESTLAWGNVNQGGIAKNIFPDEENVNEHTHIFKVDLTGDRNGWDIQDHARVEVYRLAKSRNDITAYSTGPTPDVIERVNQSVHYTLGANTFRLEKQITDWWLASFGSLLSRYDGASSFNQNAVDGMGTPTFGSYWSAQGITLKRDSKVVSLASLFLPMKGLSISAGAQGEWTGESGLGNVNLDFGDPEIPGSFFLFPGTVNANQSRTEFSENVDALFTRLPRTVLFADARLQQERVGQFDEADNTLEPFQDRTDALNHLYNASAGFTTSPWMWMEWGAHLRRRESATGYNHLVDESPLGGEGYPAFIRHRDIAMNEVEARLVLRPVFWFNALLTYDWDLTDFSSATDPVNDAFLGLISPGEEIFDGQTESHNFGLNVTFTPISRFYFSGSFTYGYSRTTTTSAASPEVVPYFGNTYTIGASAGWMVNAKTDLNAAYNFSQGTYGQNNAAGIPLGLDFTRHELLVSLTRQLTTRLTGALHYQFSQYAEPSGGNANNFIAHGIFATLTYKWP